MNNQGGRKPKRKAPGKFLMLLCVLALFMATGCIQEKLADNQLPPGPYQSERWLCTVRAPIGTWKYRIGINPKMVNNQWTSGSFSPQDVSCYTIDYSSDTAANTLASPADTVTVKPTYATPPATGEVATYGNKTFRFYTENVKFITESKNDSKPWMVTYTDPNGITFKELFNSASLLFEPFNYHPGKDFFVNQMVVRFYIYKGLYLDKYGTVITNAAVAGDFNMWGKGGERNKYELKDDGVWPDKTAGDGIFTVEVPVESTYTYEYRFYLNPQWDATAGQWKDGSYTLAADLANPRNRNEDLSGNSIISIR